MRNLRSPSLVPGRALVALLGLVLSGCGDDPTPPDVDVPPEPVNLHVAAGSLADTLAWSRSAAADFGAYLVRRRDDTSPFPRLIATVQTAQDTAWVDTTVTPRHAYEYSVLVQDLAGQVSTASLVPITTSGTGFLALGLHPRTYEAAVGDTVDVALWVDGASELFGAVVGLSWDQSRLALLDCRTGSWMGTESLFLCQEETQGVTVAATRLGDAPALEGWGDLAMFRVLILAPGEIALSVAAPPVLQDRDAAPIPGSPARVYGAEWSAGDSLRAAPRIVP